jgi:hypothetical protein
MTAAMLYPDRRVRAVCGDAGFMMNSQELETASRLGLDLVVLVLQDNAFGMIRWKQAVDGLPDFGITFGNPDFVTYARAYHMKGSRVESADGLVPALNAAFADGGVHIVSVPVDYARTAGFSSTSCKRMRQSAEDNRDGHCLANRRVGGYAVRSTTKPTRYARPYGGEAFELKQENHPILGFRGVAPPQPPAVTGRANGCRHGPAQLDCQLSTDR